MSTPRNAVIIDPADTVAVSIQELRAGDMACATLPDGTTEQISITTDVPLFHKFARRPMAEGEAVVKYGAYIATATEPIARGAWVHVHNAASSDAQKQEADRG
ncbi:UxaA family hydrolase [Olsenella sp. YH-ols2217]|uniref:UxaA family hydrolase n=1 Tax=Kribbibacterium absianum TaxID=3044210 RepID=A0ABT6ZLM8_9ACTN|nr:MULTISPECIES: UxaA family hydrolase [unclassified Olsenella]MDJ1121706.1 UxaA family hydrolase [Olsenella sp. YH-ols2216]MDJ1129714.1 UxaA family hydrolase [Olsenella sp. YH-ols2217]